MGIPSVHHMFFSATLSLEKDSSPSSPVLVWDLSHERLFSMNFSIMSPFQRLQFFINCSNLSTFHSPSGADCSSMGPSLGQKSCQQTCSTLVQYVSNLSEDVHMLSNFFFLEYQIFLWRILIFSYLHFYFNAGAFTGSCSYLLYSEYGKQCFCVHWYFTDAHYSEIAVHHLECCKCSLLLSRSSTLKPLWIIKVCVQTNVLPLLLSCRRCSCPSSSFTIK